MTSSPSPDPRAPIAGGPPTQTLELPAYLPGELLDLPSPDITIPTRGIRPRKRSRLQRVVIGLTSGTALLVLAGVLVLATLLSPVGARRAARRAAEQELRAELDSGEKVLAQSYVSQRNWWDNFRESFGVLAATDRRLIFVGLPPTSWIRGADDDGPPEFRVQSFSYEDPFQPESKRQLLWTTPGVRIKAVGGNYDFLVPRGESQRAVELEQLVQRSLVARSAIMVQEQQERVAPPRVAEVYGYVVVHGGESVTSLARRYRTTPDVIRQLNRLPNDRIRIGQRLRVPMAPGLTDSTTAPPGRAPQAVIIP